MFQYTAANDIETKKEEIVANFHKLNHKLLQLVQPIVYKIQQNMLKRHKFMQIESHYCGFSCTLHKATS